MYAQEKPILTANREMLARKDAESAEGKVLRRESRLCLLRWKRDGQDGIYPGTRNSLRRIVCS